MCVIIEKPRNKFLRRKDLESIWLGNKDGAGILIPDIKEPIMVKGIMSLEDLWTMLKTVGNQYCLVHCRFATHGTTDRTNTHPFPMGTGRYLMHNGVLSHFGNMGEKGESDTAHLASDLSTLKSDAIRRILSSISGKFVFVDHGTVSFHGNFEEFRGCRYSNLSWCPSQYPKMGYGHYRGYYEPTALTKTYKMSDFNWGDD